MAVVSAIASLVGAGVSVYSAREAREQRKEVEKKRRRKEAEQRAQIAAQEAEEERIRIRDIQRAGRRRRAGTALGPRQTILTGPLGIRDSAPGTEGGKTLLGL